MLRPDNNAINGAFVMNQTKQSWLADFPFWLYRLAPSGKVMQRMIPKEEEQQESTFPHLDFRTKLQDTCKAFPEVVESFEKALTGEKVNVLINFKSLIYSIWLYPIVEESRVSAVYLICSDINDNIEIHNEIIRKINFFNKIQRVGRVGIFEVDFRKSSVYWTEETYKIYNCPESFQPTLENSFNFIHEEDIQGALLEYYTAIGQERYYKLNYRIRTPENETRYIEAHGEIIRSSEGKPLQLFGVVRDVTEESRYKALLQKNNQKLNTILESMTEGFLAVGADHIVTYVNRSALEILGQKRVQLVGENFYQIELFRQEEVWQKYYQRSKKQQKVVKFEWLHPAQGIWIEVRLSPTEEGVSILLNNIHARKTIADSLKDINEAKDRLFSIIAHDLRSPLNNISGIMHLYEQFGEHMSRQELEELFQQTQQASKNAYNLLEDLLTWSRNQTNSNTFNPKLFSLPQLLDRVAEQQQMSAGQKVITLNAYTDKKVCCFGDEDMISTVLRNFITNAIKFTPRGGKITLHARSTKDCTILAVRDNGVGMEQETVENLFRIDKKVKSKGTDGESGSGLGLKICKQLVDKHNGQIQVRSELRKGTSLFVMIPNLAESKKKDCC